MDWDVFLKRCCVSFVQLLAMDLAKSVYAGNKEYVDNKLRELLKNDPFAIEIERKDNNTGYM